MPLIASPFAVRTVHRLLRSPKALALTLVAALMITVWIAFISSRPAPKIRLFGEVGNSFGGKVLSAQPVYANTELDPGPTVASVDLVSVTPIVVANSARVSMRVLVCRVGNGSGIGIVYHPRDYCVRVEPLRAGTVVFAREQLMLAMTAQARGVFHANGFRVVYRYGGHEVLQDSGIEMRFASKTTDNVRVRR